MTVRDIVVVGAGAAGLSLVEALRREGHDGPITIVGDETDLPYDRPPLSKGYLSGEWDDAQLQLRSQEIVDGLGADWRLGRRATRLDAGEQRVHLDDGTSLAYDALVVATGVRARRLPGTDGIAGLHVLRTREDASRLRSELATAKHLLVVGGGFLGSETAASAQELGRSVTLISRRATPLSDVLGDEVAGVLAEVHRERGVAVEQGSVASVLSENGQVAGVRLDDGRELAGDVVLLAIGSHPNVEWLDGSGLEIGDGIVCDPSGAAAPGVWAIGDVAAWFDPILGRPVRLEHRTNATEQAMAVAKSILGTGDPLPSVPYVWSDQYEYKVQIYGIPRGAEQFTVLDGSLEDRKFTALYARDGQVCAAVGINMVRPLRGLRRHVAERTAWEAATPSTAVAAEPA